MLMGVVETSIALLEWNDYLASIEYGNLLSKKNILDEERRAGIEDKGSGDKRR